MWQVKLHPLVDKLLRKLNKKLEQRMQDRLRKLKDEPFRYLEHLEGLDYYKLRIGEYRALIDVDFENKIIKVQVLDHRSKIYKRYKR
jgi:mRNA interferase RelE/StbE